MDITTGIDTDLYGGMVVLGDTHITDLIGA